MSKTKLTVTVKKEWVLLLHIFSLSFSHSPPSVSDSDTNIHFFQNPICSVAVMQSLPRKVLVDLGSSVEQPTTWILLTARWEG